MNKRTKKLLAMMAAPPRLRRVSGLPPLSYTAKKADFLTDYRIYGQTVDGESVGDRTANLFDCDNTKDTEVNGIVWSCKNQIITANGATGNLSSSTFGHKRITGLYGSFILACVSDTNNDCICVVSVQETQSSTRTYNISTTNSYATFSLTGEEYEVIVYAQVNKNKEVNNAQFFISLTEGSTPPDTYEPYGYKVPMTVEGKNLLPNTATSQTINGVTITVNEDGSITCNGTATNTVEIRLVTFFSLPAGNYRLTGTPSSGSASSYFLRVWYDSGTTIVWLIEDGSGYNFTLTDTATMYSSIVIRPDKVLNHITFYPMIRKADIEDDTYEPYHEPITTSIYLPEQIRKVGDEAEYIDYGEQKLHRVGAEDIDVTLPVLPTVTGTNVLSVGTEVQPSEVEVTGRIRPVPTGGGE